MRKVLILGGYGNFGQKISTRLAKSGISIIIAGRSKEKAEIRVHTAHIHVMSPDDKAQGANDHDSPDHQTVAKNMSSGMNAN